MPRYSLCRIFSSIQYLRNFGGDTSIFIGRKDDTWFSRMQSDSPVSPSLVPCPCYLPVTSSSVPLSLLPRPLTHRPLPVMSSPVIYQALGLILCRCGNTSFQYARYGSNGEKFLGRVKAIADGALVLKTNKVKDNTKYCIWSKQRYAISFEVIPGPPDPYPVFPRLYSVSGVSFATRYLFVDSVFICPSSIVLYSSGNPITRLHYFVMHFVAY